MEINKKLFKKKINFVLNLVVIVAIISCLYNEFYVNGNNESNIKRSIAKLQNEDFENISISETIELDNKLVVIYNKQFEHGAAEFTKNILGNYKINSSMDENIENIGFYMPYATNKDNQYFIIYGDGNNIELSKVEVGINNNIVSIDIPKKEFTEIINITQYNADNRYSFTYKFYDKLGNEVEQS